MSESTALVDIRAKIQAEVAAQRASYEAPTASKISTKNKRFTLPDGTSHQGPLKVVILDFTNTRTYYTGVYNASNIVPPRCFAAGKSIQDLAPSASIEEPMAEDCASCSMNQWGSDPQGGKGKACKSGVRLMLVAADIESGAEPLALDVTPTGMRSWNGLLANLSARGIAPMQAVVEIGLNPDVSYPTLTFEFVEQHDRLEQAWTLREKAEPLLEKHPQDK